MGLLDERQVLFTVRKVHAHHEVARIGATHSLEHRLSFVLRADSHACINTADGNPLSSTDVHLSLFSSLAKPENLLESGGSGVLMQSEQRGRPYVHGIVVWPAVELPYHLVAVPLVKVSMSLALPGGPAHSEVFSWEQGKASMLRVETYGLSCWQGDEE